MCVNPLADVHRLFARRYTPSTRPWFPFHRDNSALTANIALSSDANHAGGRLLSLFDGEVHVEERAEGEATVHQSGLLHAVTCMHSGARYSLIVFFGPERAYSEFS